MTTCWATACTAMTVLRRSLPQLLQRRALGTVIRPVVVEQQQQQRQLDADRRQLLDFFPSVVRDVQEASRVVDIPPETERIARVLEYNVPGGKLLRSCAALNACRELVTHRAPPHTLYLAWTFDMLQGAYTILDDLCDEGSTRRGRPCWHTLPDVGLAAVNDSCLLESAAYQLLQRHFAQEDSHVPLLELFFDTTFRSLLGQNHDVHATARGVPQFHKFTWRRYAAQARYKTSYYTFYAPTAAAMLLAGIRDPGSHQVVWDIAADIGVLYTAQDDFLDCFASERSTGKSKGDIRNGKCTWLVLEAMRRADAKQTATLMENYGRGEAESVRAVEELYERLEVREAFFAYQRRTLHDLQRRILQQRAVRASTLQYVLDSVRHHVPQG